MWVDELRDEFGDLRLAEMFVSEDGVDELFAPGAPLGSFEAFVNARATRGAGAALAATDDGLALDVSSLLDSERAENAPGFFAAFPGFEPGLADEATRTPSPTWRWATPPAASRGCSPRRPRSHRAWRPGSRTSPSACARPAASASSVSCCRAAVLAGGGGSSRGGGAGGGQGGAAEAGAAGRREAAPQPPATTPSLGAPFVTMVVDEVDTEQAIRALARLQRSIATALDPDRSLQAPVFDEQRIDGVEAQSLRVSPTVELTYAVFDGRLAISTDPEGIEQVVGDGSSLEGSDRFESATDGLSDEVSALAYLNIEGLLRSPSWPAGADPAYASFSDELRRLDALAVAVRQDDDRIDTELRLAVGE